MGKVRDSKKGRFAARQLITGWMRMMVTGRSACSSLQKTHVHGLHGPPDPAVQETHVHGLHERLDRALQETQDLHEALDTAEDQDVGFLEGVIRRTMEAMDVGFLEGTSWR